MAGPSRKEIVRAVMGHHGWTYAEELKIRVERNTPSVLFQLAVAAELFSIRISANAAVSAARALFEKGWRTPQKMCDSTWRQRVQVLNRAGYARYDESTSAALGENCRLLLDKYNGDLRKLREAAGREPEKERELLKELKGIGDVGVDIFFREVQVAWDELYPFADRRARDGAEELGLPTDAKGLARLVDRKDFARFVAGLVRLKLAKDADAVREAAGKGGK